jgi:tetraacyldisaccharide 4'-kinase
VLTRADQVDAAARDRIRERAEKAAGAGSGVIWAEARHAPRDVLIQGEAPRPVADLMKGRIAAFCGIGNPAAFEATLEDLGLRDLVGFRAFPDHHSYTAADVADLARWAAGLRADLILTTQKDSVKLRTPALGPVPLGALRIGLEITRGAADLTAAVDRATPDAP